MGNFSWFGEFKDHQKEQSFRRYKWPSARIRLLFLYLVTIVAFAAAACGDFYELGSGRAFNIMFIARSIVCFIGIFSFVTLWGEKGRVEAQYTTMCLYMLSFMLVESLELLVKSSIVSSLSIPATVFVVLSYYILLPPTLLPALVSGLGGTAVYLISLSYVVPLSTGVFINSALFFILANAFGIYFMVSFGLSLRREFEAMSDLKALVEYDELTGVCSRRKVLEAGEALFKSSRRFSNSMSVLMMDIDYFKMVNDNYGHHVGDEVLKEAARRCSEVLREVDYIGRLGGEEFVILLPHSNLHQALKVAERLRHRVDESEFLADGTTLSISVSIGAAELRNHGDFSKLLQDADMQLYRAKKCGRNQVSPGMLKVIEGRL